MFHNTWSAYEVAMRIYKHYHLNVEDSATAASSMSFSGYAGISFTCICSHLGLLCSKQPLFSGSFFAARYYASAALAVMRCLSVCVCPSRSWIVSKRINLSSKFFSPSGSHTILVFVYQTSWQYSDGNPSNGGVECRWGKQKNVILDEYLVGHLYCGAYSISTA